MEIENKLKCELKSILENVSLSRLIVSGFLLNYNLVVSTINEIKTIVSEAITNSIVHGYLQDENNIVTLELEYKNDWLTIIVTDDGVGIDDIEEAKMPLFTTKQETERSGLGFTIMEMFSDEMEVYSKFNNQKGTKVICKKYLGIN